METRTFTITIVLSFLIQHSAFGQGALTPPGAPAPTMKTLAQIEPRTPISSAPFTINSPGSYFLTGNLAVSSGNAIVIATNGVTLDLNGFTISSTEASPTGTGILINGTLRNITLANGFIQGGVTNNGLGVYSGNGFAYGISDPSDASANVIVSRISVSGCLTYGIRLGGSSSTIVDSCTIRTVGSIGIIASTIKQSVADDCGSYAVYGNEVSDCRGQCSGSGAGITGTTVLNSYGYSSGSGNGITAFVAQNCYGYSNSGYGVLASATAHNCYGFSNSGTGVYAINAQNCYGSSYGGGDGIYANTSAIGCTGYSSSGRGLYAFIANICSGSTSSGTALSTVHNIYSY